jgi:hypothetical protein
VQGSDVGPGLAVPQRRMTRAGSPQAAVAWLVVVRFFIPSSSWGSANMTSAHVGFVAEGAGCTVSAVVHATSPGPSRAAVPANATARRVRAER